MRRLAGEYHAVSTFMAYSAAANITTSLAAMLLADFSKRSSKAALAPAVPGYSSQLLALPSCKSGKGSAAKASVPADPFPDTATVHPFEAQALDDALAVNEMPLFQLSKMEAAAGDCAKAAVHVTLAFSSQAVRVGQCVLMRLRYSTATGEVRLHGVDLPSVVAHMCL